MAAKLSEQRSPRDQMKSMNRDNTEPTLPISSIPSLAEEENGDDSEGSFEIIGKSLPIDMDHFKESHLQLDSNKIASLLSSVAIHTVSRDDDSKNVATASAPSDDLPVDVEVQRYKRRLEGLLHENGNLKERMVQNTQLLESHQREIEGWHSDVEGIVGDYKKRLDRAKEVIASLNAENARLSFEAEKYKEIKILQQEELLKLRNASKNGSSIDPASKSGANIDPLLPKLQEAHKHIDTLVEQLAKSDKTCANLTIENDRLKGKLQMAYSLVETHKKESANYEASYSNLARENEDLKSKLVEVSNTECCTKANEKIIELQKTVEMYERDKEQLKAENEKLKLENERLRADDEESKVDLRQYKEQLILAQRDLKSMREKFEKDEMQRSVAETAVETEEIKALRADVFALESQLQLYKSDYESEVAQKSTIRQERDQLAQDLQDLQRRNEQLQEEISLHRDRNFVVFTPEPSTGATQAGNSPTFTRYCCPVCGVNFRSLKLVQEHVDCCINNAATS